jgi:hypothetical protein
MPSSVVGEELVTFDRLENDLAKEQGIPSGEPVELRGSPVVQRAAERGLEEKSELGLCERLQLELVEELVLPERADRVGYRFAAPHRDEESRVAGKRQLVSEHRRRVVEKMRVVDDQQQPVGKVAPNRVARARQEVGSGLGFGVLGK